MTHPDFSIHDVRYRRSADHESQIIVYGHTVGTITRLSDPGAGEERWTYLIHLHDDPRGPHQVHRRSQIRLATADMLWERRLVPPPPLPGHPMVPVRHAASARS